jgi:hypothetical protein
VFKRIFANIYQNQMAMEIIAMASDTDWTIVPPAALTDGPATGRCRVAEGYAILGGNHTPRADLAGEFLAPDRIFWRISSSCASVYWGLGIPGNLVINL